MKIYLKALQRLALRVTLVIVLVLIGWIGVGTLIGALDAVIQWMRIPDFLVTTMLALSVLAVLFWHEVQELRGRTLNVSFRGDP